MAASSLNASNSQILSLKLTRMIRFCMTFPTRYKQTGIKPKAWWHAGIMRLKKSKRALIVCSSQSSLVNKNEPVVSTLEEEGEQGSIADTVSQLIPNSDEVKFLLTEICDKTSVSEFELKLNGFHLRVTRALSGAAEPIASSSPQPSTSISENTTAEASSLNRPVSTSAQAICKPGSLAGESWTLLERAADEGLVIIRSPKVGFFQRSRTIKGRRAPPACEEKQLVKEGQVICYIEQLGSQFPVKTDVAGEVIKILCEDGGEFDKFCFQ
uniref:Acetyl-CoA carboxylase n=1 Tax=Opuntia streptacantha TaxID=393608 RepID=A0A7C9CYM3_OPUST